MPAEEILMIARDLLSASERRCVLAETSACSYASSTAETLLCAAAGCFGSRARTLLDLLRQCEGVCETMAMCTADAQVKDGCRLIKTRIRAVKKGMFWRVRMEGLKEVSFSCGRCSGEGRSRGSR